MTEHEGPKLHSPIGVFLCGFFLLLCLLLGLEMVPYFKASIVSKQLRRQACKEEDGNSLSEREIPDQPGQTESGAIENQEQERERRKAEADDSLYPDDYRTHAGNIRALQLHYPEILAWLWIPELSVDEAVCRSLDNPIWYLNHLADGSENPLGALFCLPENADSDLHLVLYGHNMRSGQKFGVLKKLEEDKIQRSCRFAFLYLPDCLVIFELYSSYLTDAEDALTYQRIRQGEEELIRTYLQETKKRNVWISQSEDDMGESAAKGDNREEAFRILTLSTCEGSGNLRRVVQYKEIDIRA